MVRAILGLMAVVVCVVTLSGSDDSARNDISKDRSLMEGLWSGSWGGGMRDGVVFQPVLAEMTILGHRAAFHGFPGGDLTGTVRLDAKSGKLQIDVADPIKDRPVPKSVSFSYELKADNLTLVDHGGRSIVLQRHPFVRHPQANARIHLVTAEGINANGELLVTEFTELRPGRADVAFFQPEKRALKLNQATVGVVQETGWKVIDIEQARGMLRDSATVAIMERREESPATFQSHVLWKEMGPPEPDSDVVRKTLSRTLRPGMLVFVIPAAEFLPRP